MSPEYFEPFPTTDDLSAHLKRKLETKHITAANFTQEHIPQERVFQAKLLATLGVRRKKRLLDHHSINLYKQCSDANER